jgi:hypothetical protein
MGVLMSSKENSSKNCSSCDEELFKKVIESKVNIEIEKVSPDGEVTFFVGLHEFGLTKEKIFQTHIGDTKFFANFAGEYIIRKNIDLFAGIMSGLDSKVYNNVVTAYTHENFGMFVSKDKIKFLFHISLLEDILNEDISRIL